MIRSPAFEGTLATVPPPQAQRADKYALYQQSVQDPDHEVALFERMYRDVHGSAAEPVVLREDFCGTFNVCCGWVASREGRRAIGVDLDPEPLAWGRRHNLSRLTPEQRARVELLERDVLQRDRSARRHADVLAAQNFSYWTFQTRDALRTYFQTARQHLAPGGVLVLDLMGGGACYEQEHEDTRTFSRIPKAQSITGEPIPAFDYVWRQKRYDPISHRGLFEIDFRFRDGSTLQRAFTYDWRFWTIPELRELLHEAGFDQSHVYWEGEDDGGEGNNQWRRVEAADPDPAWIAYIAATR